jgi:hypothetical protein
MKSVNHYGLYKHLNEVESVDDIDFDLTRTSLITRDSYENFQDQICEENITKINKESP